MDNFNDSEIEFNEKLYKFNEDEFQKLLDDKPWENK
jgi:hypothetical protein